MTDDHNKKAFITYCGVYCGACRWRRAGQEKDDRHLSEKTRTLEPKELQYWLACPGCRAGQHRADCDFRICAEGKGLTRCIDCPEFPCKLHQEFNSDGVPHHSHSIESLAALKELGEDGWLEMQEKKWTCSCGAKLSWYLKRCLKCGKPVQDNGRCFAPR